MDIAKKITELREEAARIGKTFLFIRGYLSVHWGIGRRGRRTPLEYIPRLIEYQLKYEKLLNSNKMD